MTTITSQLDPPLDPTLCELATSQHGVLTTTQLAAAGMSAPALVALVRSGALQHPGRGLYVVASMARADQIGRHRQLVAGAFVLYPDAVLTSTSALLAQGLSVWGADLSRPSILRPVNRSGGVGCFWVRARRWGREVVETPWGPAATTADALAQLAVDAGIGPGVACADAALRLGLVTPGAMSEAVDAMGSWPRRSRAVTMNALGDGRRESVGESRVGVVLAGAGIIVVPQYEVRDESGVLVGRVDFLVEGTSVVIEFDGKVKFGSGEPEVLWREKRREDRIRRLGYRVVRLTWEDLERSGAVVARVRAALAEG
ncbi:MAG: type IV toxin-antitoxin system AbiEi family antitoxin domain-containing protein [Dermatophilaceae bacterium]